VYSFSVVFPHIYGHPSLVVATFSLQHGRGNMVAAMFLKTQMGGFNLLASTPQLML
jgi:hypothetical protein